jgi:hypothetical protein
MNDALPVKVRHAETELSEDPPRLGQRKSPVFDEVIEQFATGAELGDAVDGGFGCEEFVEGEEVQVAESAIVVQLASEEGERGRGVVGLAGGERDGRTGRWWRTEEVRARRRGKHRQQVSGEEE